MPRHMFLMCLAAAFPALAPISAVASDTTHTDPCINAVIEANGPDAPKGGTVLREDFSQAGTLVYLEDAEGQTWRCISYSDGAVGELTKIAASDVPQDVAVEPSPIPTAPDDIRVQFDAGTSGSTETATLGSGDAVVYLLGASEGQVMGVTVDASADNTFFILYAPTGDIMFESSQGGRSYRGQLFTSGDHRVEVFYNGDVGTTSDVTTTFGIE